MNRSQKLKQYFTPKNIANFIVDNLDIKNIQTVIDLSVGEGDLLVACMNKWNNAQLIGFDIDEKVLSKFKGEITKKIELNKGDSLNNKTYLKSEKYNKILSSGGFDLCIGNPPFDAYHKLDIRGKKVTVPIEYLFLKKYISICKENGYVVIILPNGILSNKYTKYIREEITNEMEICTIIGLPYNVFSKAYAKTEVIIMKKKSYDSNKYYNIEFIDLDNDMKVQKFKIENLNKSELIERMDCDYYINKRKISYDNNINIKKMDFIKLSVLIKEHNRGDTVYGEKRYFVNKGLRYLHTTNITDIGINYSKKELYIEENSIMDKKTAHTRIGDVLFVRVGNNCAGRTAIVNSKDDIGVASDCIYIFRLKGIDPYYFVIIMKTNFMRRRLNLLKHGSCASVISKRDLLDLKIPIMDYEIQKKVHLKYKRILNKYKKSKDKESLKNLQIEINKIVEMLEKLLGEEENDEISS